MRTCVDDNGLDAIGMFDIQRNQDVSVSALLITCRYYVQNNVCVRKLINEYRIAGCFALHGLLTKHFADSIFEDRCSNDHTPTVETSFNMEVNNDSSFKENRENLVP